MVVTAPYVRRCATCVPPIPTQSIERLEAALAEARASQIIAQSNLNVLGTQHAEVVADRLPRDRDCPTRHQIWKPEPLANPLFTRVRIGGSPTASVAALHTDHQVQSLGINLTPTGG